MRRSIVLVLPFFLGLGAPALASDWISSAGIAGFEELPAADRRRIAPLVADRIIEYSFEDKAIPWRIHRGDLAVAGNFDNDAALIVDGSLRIDGSYDDYRSGEGLLIVLGDLEADHVFTWNGLYVRGAVRAKGLVYGAYNDYAFEVDGKVSARGIVMDDHTAAYEAERAEFDIANYSPVDEEAYGKMIRLMLPETLTDPGSLKLGVYSGLAALWPSYGVAKNLMHAGRPLFREREAPEGLVADAKLAVAPESRDQQLLPIVGRDPLTDRLIAARPRLSPPLISALAARRDPGVRVYLASHVTDLRKLGGVSALTVPAAQRLVANPATPEATLMAIAGSGETGIRRTLTQRQDLPPAVLAKLAQDAIPGVRAGVLSNYDNAERLPAAEKARLSKDPDSGVRAAIAAVPLPYEISAALARDEIREVRMALALSLALQINLPFPALEKARREELAELLWGGEDEQIAARVFVALPPARQVEIYLSGRSLDWSEIARSTRSVELMTALLEKADDHEVQRGLADNLALPLGAQLKIAERAAAETTRECADCFGYSKAEDVFADLLRNPNLAPPVLEQARELAALRPEGNFAQVLADYTPMTAEELAVPLGELAEKSRSAATYVDRRIALELYQVRQARAW